MEALAAQRANDEALDHDDPVEEVFEDQVACADLIVLTKADLLDDAGLERRRLMYLNICPGRRRSSSRRMAPLILPC